VRIRYTQPALADLETILATIATRTRDYASRRAPCRARSGFHAGRPDIVSNLAIPAPNFHWSLGQVTGSY
jgi:hypothetical protein